MKDKHEMKMNTTASSQSYKQKYVTNQGTTGSLVLSLVLYYVTIRIFYQDTCAASNCESALQLHLQRGVQLNDFFCIHMPFRTRAYNHTLSIPDRLCLLLDLSSIREVISDSVFFIHVHKDLELLFPPYEQMPICLPGIKLVHSVGVIRASWVGGIISGF